MTSNNSVRNIWLAWYVAMLAILAVTAGCVTLNPISSAKTLEQKVFATYGSFVVFEEQAAKLAAAPDLPLGVRAALSKADAAAKPAADQLLAAALTVIEIKTELAAGTSTEERLAVAVANLERWYREAAPLVNNLIVAVEGATK